MQGKVPSVPIFEPDDDGSGNIGKAQKRNVKTTETTLTEDERDKAEEKRFERRVRNMERTQKLMRVANAVDSSNSYVRVTDEQIENASGMLQFWIGMHAFMNICFVSFLQSSEEPLNAVGFLLLIHVCVTCISMLFFSHVHVLDYKLKWSGQAYEPSMLKDPLCMGGVKSAFTVYALACAIFLHNVAPLWCMCVLHSFRHPFKTFGAWFEFALAFLLILISGFFLEIWKRSNCKNTTNNDKP